ncbi:hypothetical protein LHP98_14580 [Rhodobacter sp. Har01]|uniref:hypothetical protein n=1 Tax=Rhodobacter sp. Har01 TaxID=2883999 RepID=UPI001D090482|nr:hypothetical protein [Rhodobacter sp. Har01]MCB6179347.1 hypothetical protein [Rhodobacter sp. Har01]
MRLAAPLSLLVLGACGALVPTTAARLAALDPLTADPAQIEVALVLPAGLQATPGTAVLDLTAMRGGQRLAERFTLSPRPAPGVGAPQGATVAGFGLAGADLQRLRDTQAVLAAWKGEGPASASLSVGIGGCTVDGGPAPEAEGAVLIRLSPAEAFRPLLGPAPLSGLLGPEALASLSPCG